jgi:hypothetical protein
MPTLAQLAAEFELLIIPHLVHLHDLGKKRLMDVSQYFRALDGIVQSSKQILAPSACWPLIFPLLS